MDGNTEDKTFGPGYGEFFTAGGGDVEALALAVSTDALPAPTPPELVTLETRADDLFRAAGSGDWKAARAAAARITSAGKEIRAGEVPDRLGPQLRGALGALAKGVAGREAHEARQAAIDVAR